MSLIKADASYVVAAIPRILSAVTSSIIQRRREASWAELRDIFFYILISLLELQLILSLSLLWLVLPGLVLVPWLSLQIAFIWFLSGFQDVPRPYTFAADKVEEGIPVSNEQALDWYVVGGFLRDEQLYRELLPKLTRIFGHDMRVFGSSRFGFLRGIIHMLLQRNLYIPTARSVALYNSVRASLLKPETTGVRILAHNTGALDVSWLLARLCADLPPGDRLSKLHVFTFGAASMEMTLPLGNSVYQQTEVNPNSPYPTVTHFAFADDPFAQIGVLLGVRQRVEGRLVGGLYTIHSGKLASKRGRFLPKRCHYTFNDYLDALLPNGDSRAGVLGQTCKIDRELSEIRELAALAQSVNNERLRTRRARLSWTALGVVADSMSNRYRDRDDMAGPLSLEEVRKRGKSLEGLKGYDKNPLADAVKKENRRRSRAQTADPDTGKHAGKVQVGTSKRNHQRVKL